MPKLLQLHKVDPKMILLLANFEMYCFHFRTTVESKPGPRAYITALAIAALG